MPSVVRTLRIIQIAMLVSIGVYIVLGELVGARVPDGNPTLFYALSALSIMTIGVILVVRRTLVLHSEATLKTRNSDPPTLMRWRTGYIVTYALAEALALFGLIVRFSGFSLSQAVTFYLPGFVLVLFFRPRLPSAEFNPS